MVKRMKYMRERIVVAILLTVLFAVFQNCSVATEFRSSEPTPAPQMNGNGTGYEGKLTTYANWDIDKTCPDQDRAKARIAHYSVSGWFLLRANCTMLATPLSISPALKHLSDRTVVVAYNNQVFESEEALVEPPGIIPARIVYAVCEAQNTTTRMEIEVVRNNGAFSATIDNTYAQDISGQTGATCVAQRLYRSTIALVADPANLRFTSVNYEVNTQQSFILTRDTSSNSVRIENRLYQQTIDSPIISCESFNGDTNQGQDSPTSPALVGTCVTLK